MDITTHAFPSLDTLEIHSVFGYPRVELGCLRQLKKLYVDSGGHRVPRSWLAGGHLDGIRDLTLPCHFFWLLTVDVPKLLSLPRGLQTLRFLSFSPTWHLDDETCTQPPADPEELYNFEACAYWLLYPQSRFPSDLKTIEVLHCLEKPQPGSEGFDAFLTILNRFEDVCKQNGLIFRTVYRRM